MSATSTLRSQINMRALTARPMPVAQTDRVNASRSVGGLAYSHVTTHREFLALEEEWHKLDAANITVTSPFQSFSWLRCWIEAHLHIDGVAETLRHSRDETGCTHELAVICGRTGDDQLAVVLPLMTCTSRAVRMLTWLGAPLAQYGDGLVHRELARPSDVAGAIAYARKTFHPDLICLPKVRADAALLTPLQKAGATMLDIEEAPFVKLTLAHITGGRHSGLCAKARKNRRRQMRRLSEEHHVRFTTLACGSAAAEAATAGLALKRRWLCERGLISSALHGDGVDAFFMRAARQQDSGCRVFTLTLDGRLAGVQIGFAHRGCTAMHLIVYDTAFEKFGIGMLQLADTIKRCALGGTQHLDLMAPSAKYKQELAADSTLVATYALPCTMRGRLYTALYLRRLRPWLKAILNAQPLAVRRWICRRLIKSSRAVSATH